MAGATNDTSGTEKLPPSIYILFSLHLLLFILAIIVGFTVWAVIRITEKLHTPINYMMAAMTAVNCVLGSASILTNLVNIAGNGFWSYGSEACTLLHSLDTCLQCGAVWTLTSILVYKMIQITKPDIYTKYISRSKCLMPMLVWLGAIIQGFMAVFISDGSFYKEENSPPWGMCANNGSTKASAIFMLVLSFVIPLALIIALYVGIVMRARQLLTRQVSPVVDSTMQKEAQSSFVRRRDCREARHWPIPMRSLSEPAMRVNSPAALSECPSLPASQPAWLTPSREPSNIEGGHTGFGGQQLKVGNSGTVSPEISTENRSSLEGLDVKREATPMQVHHPADCPGLNYPGLLPNMAATDSVPSHKDPHAGPGPSWHPTLRHLPSPDQPDPHRGRNKDQQTPDKNDKGDLRRTGVDPRHGQIAPDTSEKTPPVKKLRGEERNKDRSLKFHYHGEQLPTDQDSWPTVFLTADTVDQVHNRSNSENLPDKSDYHIAGHMPKPGATMTKGRNKVGVVGQDTIGASHKIPPTQLNKGRIDAPDEKYSNIMPLLSLILPYTLLWLPHNLLLLMISLDAAKTLDFVSYNAIEMLGKCNFLLNPALYFMFIPEFKRSLRCVLGGMKRNPESRNEADETDVGKVGEESGEDALCDNLTPQFTSRPNAKPMYLQKVSLMYSVEMD